MTAKPKIGSKHFNKSIKGEISKIKISSFEKWNKKLRG
jgi:hypothetical protein